MRTKAARDHQIPDHYEDLVAQFMPRPLHDGVDYRNALAVLDRMAGFKLNADQEDYFEAIATFVERYEAQHHRISGVRMKPLELLRALMDERGMNGSELGRLLGDRSLGHRILTGERQLSKSHIRTIAKHFGITPAALL